MKVKRKLLINATLGGVVRTITAHQMKSAVRDVFTRNCPITAVAEIIENDEEEKTKADCCRKTASSGED